MATAEPIRDKKQLRKMTDYWLKRGNPRNHAIIVLGAYTALRIVDILRLRWEDVYDAGLGEFRSHVDLSEKKTGKQKVIALNSQAIAALKRCLAERQGEYVFGNNRKLEKPISRVHAWRIIRAAAEGIEASGRISCHSLRKTFGYFAWKAGEYR
ncbi:MAG: tyrosine-type recombinase/integrase [Holophagaceae bacterium]|nr:tyrosine-type recombinase/integrase [Holophagaceae bacterium]